MNGKKLGQILLDENVLTKRQLQRALDIQNNGDSRKLGEILVELGYLTIEDLTDVMMDQASHAQDEVQKGSKVTLLKQGWVVTNKLEVNSKPTVGAPAYYASSGLLSTTNPAAYDASTIAGASNPLGNEDALVGRFLSTEDADGYAKVYIDIA